MRPISIWLSSVRIVLSVTWKMMQIYRYARTYWTHVSSNVSLSFEKIGDPIKDTPQRRCKCNCIGVMDISAHRIQTMPKFPHTRNNTTPNNLKYAKSYLWCYALVKRKPNQTKKRLRSKNKRRKKKKEIGTKS